MGEGEYRMAHSVKPNCFRCRYFRVTWERQNPRACEAYGFKRREVPAAVVLRSSGLPCMKYAPKEGNRS